MYRVELAFGHSDSNGLAVPAEQIKRAEHLALRHFALQFNGAQLLRHPGAYRHNDSRVITEPSTTVWAYALDAQPDVTPLSAIAREIATMLRQESVLLVIVELQGHMYWVHLEPNGAWEPMRVSGHAA